jgi:hypothetical protein
MGIDSDSVAHSPPPIMKEKGAVASISRNRYRVSEAGHKTISSSTS